MGTKQADIGNSDKSPLLAGPELYDGPLLWDFRCCIEVGKADTAEVGSQADENVPARHKNIMRHLFLTA